MEKDCLFCQIIQGAKPAEFLYKGESVVVFRDIHPQAPIHFLIVPKSHIRSINDLRDRDRDIMPEILLKARDMAEEHGIAQSGYKLVFNVERGGGQLIFHLHLHLLGGW